MTSQNPEYFDLETAARCGQPVTVDRYFKIRIDDRSYNVDDPKLTGSLLLRLSGKRPIDEYLVFLKLANGGFEEIRLDETVDLTQPGVERFMTFESSASYRLVIDGERIEWGAQLITGLKLKQIAGVDPDKYALWREVRGSEDIELANEDIIDLSEPGLERFFTVIAQTTAGDAGPALPQGDQRYLSEQGYRYELAYEAGQTAIILRAVDLPKGRYDVELADILIMLPPGYPDAPPDMFYCLPWLRLVAHGAYPNCADVPLSFQGQTWQRWSRHNNEWRPGKDGIWTMLKRVEHALAEAA
ncbi:MAG: hypothetical protein C0421_14755 [Hyphomonas sp.]|uniref:multiubiquitin domain-containing protein n=1 Tax=Hyphomonas sp. TaxID=87 RepID=UPI0025C5856F|nr:multiubiquitin domain-containing protein [Hyphomonas sp.]MBA4340089.1 hypothetical protein [Hyphomonas sp.]